MIPKDIFVKFSKIAENRRKMEEEEEEKMLQQAIALSLSEEGQHSQEENPTGKIAYQMRNRRQRDRERQ